MKTEIGSTPAMKGQLSTVLPDPLPRFLTVPEVAALLRVKRRTVYDWVQNGHIPHHRPARSRFILFDREEVIAWMRGETPKMRHPKRSGD